MTFHLGLKSNAFRVLGLDPSASLAVILERANELHAYSGIEQVPTYWSDWPVFEPPKRTPETVAAAVHRLEDPLMRLLDEATWFHALDHIDASAVSDLAESNVSRAGAIWKGATIQSTDPMKSLHYQHNLAVLCLCAAEIPATALSSRDVWDRVLESWTPLLNGESLWQQIVAQSPAGKDRICPADAASKVRFQIGHDIAHRFSSQAVEALDGGRTDEALAWVSTLSRSRFPTEFVVDPVNDVIESLADRIRTDLKSLQAPLNQKVACPPDIQSIESQLHIERSTFEQFQNLGIKSSPALQVTADLIAEAYQSLALYYNNEIDNTPKALELLDTAMHLATAEGLRIKLQQDARTLRQNIATVAFHEAVKIGDYAGGRRAFDSLEQNQDPGDGQETLQPFREAMRGLRIFQDCQPIKKAPGLSTFNGVGTMLYGHSDEVPETGTYLATRFFTFLFLPLIALGRYRVQNRGNGQYQFYGRAPLTKALWAWNATVVGITLLGLLFVNGQEGSRSAMTPNSPPKSDTPAVLSDEIQHLRSVVEAEQLALKVEREAITQEENALDALRAKVEERRALYGDTFPPEELAQDQQAVAEHNRRFRALQTQIDTYNARIDALKRKVGDLTAIMEQHNARQ